LYFSVLFDAAEIFEKGDVSIDILTQHSGSPFLNTKNKEILKQCMNDVSTEFRNSVCQKSELPFYEANISVTP